MTMRLWTALILTLAGATTIAWLVALMHERNIRPVRDLVTLFKKQSKVGRGLLGTFFIAMWVIASTKPGGEGNGEQGTGNGSQFWHFVTPSNTLQLTWQNVLFERLTNTPVSVQMEACPNGRFAYRYDLSRLGVDEVTNILVGASLGSLAWTTNALPANITSLVFYPLAPEDAANTDRDGDGHPGRIRGSLWRSWF